MGRLSRALRALVGSLKDRRRTERFVVDGQPVRASILLVANNVYRVDLFSIGERDRIDEGTLAIYAARGLRRLRWTERKATEVRIETRRSPMRAAVDGEPAALESPSSYESSLAALRLRLPEEHEAQPGSTGLLQEQ